MNDSTELRPGSRRGRLVGKRPAAALLVVCGVFALCSCAASHPAAKSVPAEPAPPLAPVLAPIQRVADMPPETPVGVVRLTGAPDALGRTHGELLGDRIRLMLGEYLADELRDGKLNRAAAARVNTLKPSLPDWYLRELSACATAAGVDEDALLYAQCEGDVKSLNGCTSYVAFGAATADGNVEFGRNFDYWGLTSLAACVNIFAYQPRTEDGYAFVSVGWSGILGGWTFINEHGLFVANNLGGFSEKNPSGVPTLILARIVAQKAASVKEAIAIVKHTPRMRGQVLILGQAGEPASGTPAAGVVVRYDAKRVEVEEATAGWAFHSSLGTNPEPLRQILRRAERKATDAVLAAGNRLTLHSVAVRPAEAALWVAHGKRPAAQEGEYVKYDLRVLLNGR